MGAYSSLGFQKMKKNSMAFLKLFFVNNIYMKKIQMKKIE
jgi:hypothetical protein